VEAYLQASRSRGFWTGSREDAARYLWAARVHEAVQWLAWGEGWEPPADHRQDWGARLLELAEEVP